MSKYQPDKNLLRISIALAAASVGGVLGMALLFSHKFSTINEEIIKTKEASISVEHGFLLKAKLNELDSSLKTLDSFFVLSGQEVEFIEKIEALASSTGVRLNINSITLDPKSGQDFKENMFVNIETEGSLKKIIEFFKKLESQKTSIIVEEAYLGVREGDTWSLRASLVAYKIKEN